jgi:RNA polymerase sigma-70 factor (ECF subfamily)
MEESVAVAKPIEQVPRLLEDITPEWLHREFANDVWRFVSSKLDHREEAEDVTMEVFLAAFSRLRDLRNIDSPKIWLLGIARHKIASRRRWWSRRRESPLTDDLIGTDPIASAERQAIRELLSQLSDDQQEALILKYVNGLSTEEVAKVIRRSPPATNSLLQRARETLRDKGSAIFLTGESK